MGARLLRSNLSLSIPFHATKHVPHLSNPGPGAIETSARSQLGKNPPAVTAEHSPLLQAPTIQKLGIEWTLSVLILLVAKVQGKVSNTWAVGQPLNAS